MINRLVIYQANPRKDLASRRKGLPFSLDDDGGRQVEVDASMVKVDGDHGDVSLAATDRERRR